MYEVISLLGECIGNLVSTENTDLIYLREDEAAHRKRSRRNLPPGSLADKQRINKGALIQAHLPSG